MQKGILKRYETWVIVIVFVSTIMGFTGITRIMKSNSSELELSTKYRVTEKLPAGS